MLNTATPTLQMKISGIALSSISTMVVMIRNVDSVIMKGNADIEVDNDIVSAFLTNEESDKISTGNYNVSIIAQDIYGEDVSDKLKVMWVKRGSMSKASAGGGSDTDLSDYYTKQEINVLISNIPSGQDGFSPIINVNEYNSNNVYKLNIITKDDSFTTPNLKGPEGNDGQNGFSPIISENFGNNDTTYKLDITTEDGTFTTPNLKGENNKIEGDILKKLNEILEMINGFSFGYTEDGKPGFKEPGKTEYKPFIGSTSGEEAPDPDNQSKIYKFNWKHGGQYNAKTTSYEGQFGFYPSEIKSVTANGEMVGKKTSTIGGNSTHTLYLMGTKIGNTSSESIQLISSISVSSTSNTNKEIKDYVVNIDKDIDWTIWDKNKPILIRYYVYSEYHVGNINLNIELQSRDGSEINIKQTTRGYNYNGLQFSKLTFFDPETISTIHLKGSLKAFSQNAYLYELGCTKGSSSFVNIVNLSTVSSGNTLDVDKAYTPVDWNTYDSEKGLMFSMYPTGNETKPGGLTGEINYTLKI